MQGPRRIWAACSFDLIYSYRKVAFYQGLFTQGRRQQEWNR